MTRTLRAQSPARSATLVCDTSACVSVCSNSLSLLSGAPLAHLRTRSTASLTCLEQQIQRGGTVQSVDLAVDGPPFGLLPVL